MQFNFIIKLTEFLCLMIVCVLLTQNKVSAQNTSSTNLGVESDIGKESKLTSSGLNQVDLLSGGCNLQIPLFDLNDFGFPLSFNLQNHTKGVKVQDRGGLTGIGWQLENGFKITRIVVDIPDDQLNEGWDFNSNTINEYEIRLKRLDVLNQYLIGTPIANKYADPFQSIGNGDPEMAYDWVALMSDKSYELDNSPRRDASPDIFMLSMNGVNIKFVFPVSIHSDGICLDKQDDIKLVKTSNGFIASDRAGNKYYFDMAVSKAVAFLTKNSREYNPFSLPTTQELKNKYYKLKDKSTLNWSLTRIEQVTGKFLAIDYELYEHRYAYNDDVLRFMTNPTNYQTLSGDLTRIMNPVCYPHDEHTYYIHNMIFVIGMKLKPVRIRSNLFSINFKYNDYGFASIADDENNLLQSIQLIPLYKKSSSVVLEYDWKPIVNNTSIFRPVISKVKFLQFDNSTAGLYKVNYNGSSAFSPHTKCFDFFDYYNGEKSLEQGRFPVQQLLINGGLANNLLGNPSTLSNIDYLQTLPNVDKNPSLLNAQMLTVKDITLPNGLKEEYEVEFNRTISSSPLSGTYCGGLRIKNIVVSSLNRPHEAPLVANYSYANPATGSQSGVATMKYTGPFTRTVNVDKHDNSSFAYLIFQIYQHNTNTFSDFWGRSCLYKFVSVTLPDGSIKRTNFSVTQDLVGDYTHSIERHGNMVSNNYDEYRLPNSIPLSSSIYYPSPSAGSVLETWTIDKNGLTIESSEYEYEEHSEQLVVNFGSHLPFYLYHLLSASNGFTNCFTCSAFYHKARSIQLAIIPTQKLWHTLTAAKTTDRFGRVTKTDYNYDATNSKLLEQNVHYEGRHTFKQIKYTSDLDYFYGLEATCELYKAIQHLPYHTPIELIEGEYINGEKYITSATSFNFGYKGRNTILGNIAVPYQKESYGLVFAKPYYQFSSIFIAPNRTTLQRDEDYKFLGSNDFDGPELQQYSHTGTLSSTFNCYDGMCPAYTISNTAWKSYYIDNFEGIKPSNSTPGYHTGTEAHNYSPSNSMQVEGNSPDKFLLVKSSDYKPEIIIWPDRINEGILLSMKYKNTYYQNINANIALYKKLNNDPGSDYILFHSEVIPITPSTTSNWSLMLKKLPITGVDASTLHSVKAAIYFSEFPIASVGSSALMIDNLILSNGGAQVQITSTDPNGEVLIKEDEKGTISKTLYNPFTLTTQTFDQNNNLIKATIFSNQK